MSIAEPRLLADTRGKTSISPSEVPEKTEVAKSANALNAPHLFDGDMFRVRNNSKRTVKFAWNRKRWNLEPKDEAIVPFEALVNALGDPRSRQEEKPTKWDDGNGNHGIVLSRHTELCRLFAMYGVQKEDVDELTRKAPRVSVMLLAGPHAGQALEWPANRPDMLPYPVADLGGKVTSDVASTMQRLEAENAQMKADYEEAMAKMDQILAAREGVDNG